MLGDASGGVLCFLASTAQKIARQHKEADTHVESRSKSIIFMNLARGIKHCDNTDIRADRYPIVSVISATAELWCLD